jgi:hypothetical protein
LELIEKFEDDCADCAAQVRRHRISNLPRDLSLFAYEGEVIREAHEAGRFAMGDRAILDGM